MQVILIILAILILISVILLLTSKKEHYRSTSQSITNPPHSYWYWRSDAGGKQIFNQDGVYIHQVVYPPNSVGECSACPADSVCYNGACLPYTNSEIYNNPCCSQIRLVEACEKWLTEDNLTWLWNLCKNNPSPICQEITRAKVSETKDLLCKLFQSVCTGALTEHTNGHCNLELSPIPLSMDADPFKAIQELFLNCPYQYSKFQAKIRVTNLQNGSRGWGFWNTTMIPSKMAMVWFMHQDGTCPQSLKNNIFCPAGQTYPLNGMYAMVVAPGLKPQMVKLNDLDENWHDYAIDWQKDKITFSIDKKIVYTEKTAIPSNHMAFHCWVDNAVFAPGHVVQNMQAPRSQDIKSLQIWV